MAKWYIDDDGSIHPMKRSMKNMTPEQKKEERARRKALIMKEKGLDKDLKERKKALKPASDLSFWVKYIGASAIAAVGAMAAPAAAFIGASQLNPGFAQTALTTAGVVGVMLAVPLGATIQSKVNKLIGSELEM